MNLTFTACQTLCSMFFDHYFSLYLTTLMIDTILFILQLGILRHREIKW